MRGPATSGIVGGEDFTAVTGKWQKCCRVGWWVGGWLWEAHPAPISPRPIGAGCASHIGIFHRTPLRKCIAGEAVSHTR